MKRILFFAALLACYLLFSCALESDRRKTKGFKENEKKVAIKVRRNHTTADDGKTRASTSSKSAKGGGSKRSGAGPRADSGCIRLGGICQPRRYVCQGHYLKDQCSGASTRQCCMPAGAWSILCAGHHNNRVRACDGFGCGAFNSNRGEDLHKAVDVVCEDYATVNAPFSGSLAGPVGRTGPNGIQYDGVKLLNDVHCVKIFNIRPYRYIGPVSQGEVLGYLLPLQERFSGITSHMELQMCDGSDPSPFI
ncbi:leukocyte cell-derived chemotaxin-2-like [Lampris incognitus]|uniref:leukocyte cell-derived chemotaxin-2-like n=1 Tax=Lampris incognitus TaxID=2546036 RepID=UPI0024B6096D|nr:leukocyte cell-derived chemotaxin-2-like [Lampris incognitus]